MFLMENFEQFNDKLENAIRLFLSCNSLKFHGMVKQSFKCEIS